MTDDLTGLTSSEAKSLLAKHGPNSLPETPPPSSFELILSQIKNPLVYILLAAATITFLLSEFADASIILFAVVINGVFGFIQEKKASNSLQALKSLIHPKTKIIRDNQEQIIEVEHLVPGDLVILDQGVKIPADGVVVNASRFFVSEAILTGESAPVGKTQKDKVFMGTVVSAGRAVMQVSLTGKETAIGRIALDVQEVDEDTPLRKQLKSFSKQLTFLVIGLTIFVFIIGLFSNMHLEEIFTTSVALAVSSIPEGILIATTVILAIGMQRILKRKGLVRHLMSAETLGGVTTVCVDKTGTLTLGKMQVTGSFGDEEGLTLQAFIANDLEDPMTIAAHTWSKSMVVSEKFLNNKKRLDTLPFDSQTRYFATLNKWNKGKNMIFVNGAPEYLLEWSNISASEKKRIKDHIELLTSQGRRIIGFARKKVSSKTNKISPQDIKNGNLEWIGLLSFTDPIRHGVKEALDKVKSAGIKFIVITGDYPKTATSVVKELGIEISENSVITGEKLQKLSSKKLSKILKSGQVALFARTTPGQKLKIIESLKANGEVVAMMGDGVNDAPALRRADIGIVVEAASDVAKETADLILLDSNFETVVAAIEEGRGIFNNIRKVFLYLVSDSFEEIIAVIGAIIFGLSIPVTAAQILWINIVSDGFPSLALTIDSKAPGIMSQPPRNSKEPLVNIWMRELIAIVSLAGGIMAFLIYYYFIKTTGDIDLARSVAFATLGVNSLVYVFSIRTLTDPFWRENPFDNPWLNLSVLGGLAFQFFPFITSSTRQFFGLTTLDFFDLLLIFGASGVMFILIELGKIYFRKQT